MATANTNAYDDFAADYDVSELPESQSQNNSARYPTLVWRNDTSPMGDGGFFYLKADDLNGQVPDPQFWQPVELYPEKGEKGFMAKELGIVFLRQKTKPFTKDKATGRKTFHKQFVKESGMQINTWLVCLVDGLDEPVIWSLHGMNSMAMTAPDKSRVTDERGGVLTRLMAGIGKDRRGPGIVKLAIDAFQRQEDAKAAAEGRAPIRRYLPRYSFRVPIGTRRDARGKRLVVGSSEGGQVTPPDALIDLYNPTSQQMKDLFLGTHAINRLGEDVVSNFDEGSEWDTYIENLHVREQAADDTTQQPRGLSPEDHAAREREQNNYGREAAVGGYDKDARWQYVVGVRKQLKEQGITNLPSPATVNGQPFAPRKIADRATADMVQSMIQPRELETWIKQTEALKPGSQAEEDFDI